jgi:hypothetical protein
MVQRLLSLVLVGMLAVMGLSAIPAQAQGGLDATQPPSFGVVDIESGFMPDPHEAAVIGGGPIDVNAELGEVCQGAANGFAASAPDYRLNYTAGEYLLRLFFVGDADSAMVINGPDGMWYCDDDGGGLRQPMLQFGLPDSGQYDIWVTSPSPDVVVSGTLYITETEIIPALDYVDAIIPTDFKDGVYGLDVEAVLGSGEIELLSGFADDPFYADVTAGGLIDVSTALGAVCEGAPVGFIPEKPHLRVNYTPGDYPLAFLYYNLDEFDTTMVVQAPDGSFFCDDDSGQLLQPLVRFDAPLAGVYNVWVGAYGLTEYIPGGLFVTETDINAQTIADELAGTGSGGASGSMDYTLAPTYGEVALETGYADDPHVLEMVAGGGVNVFDAIGGMCDGTAAGYAAEAPDYRLQYTAGTAPLRVFFVSEGDTTLAVNAPDGGWYCSDDAGGTLNGMVEFTAPLSGQYDIWVGAFSEGEFIDGTLYITELALDPGTTSTGK